MEFLEEHFYPKKCEQKKRKQKLLNNCKIANNQKLVWIANVIFLIIAYIHNDYATRFTGHYLRHNSYADNRTSMNLMYNMQIKFFLIGGKKSLLLKYNCSQRML